MFQETGDRQNYQGRYVIRHPYTAATTCDATHYQAAVKQRQENEAQTLANLTGWDINDIRAKIPFLNGHTPESPIAPWWKRLWQ